MSEIRTFEVPGRVNLVGEHLDYNGGPVLPMAIDKHVVVKARVRDDDQVHVWSRLGRTSFPTAVGPGDVGGWAALVAGVVWAFEHPAPGLDLVIEGDLPDGAGLSSSAATACGVAMALADAAGVTMTATEVAALARRSENEYLGAPVGVMDQLAVVHDGASLIDTRDGSLREVPIEWPGLSLVVIDTQVKHSVAAGEYAARHDECRRATDALGLTWLAEAGPDAVLRFEEDDVLKRRVRHVVTETTRVRGAVRAIESAQWEQLGGILTSSHESLRDDFEVSCAELDAAVAAALDGGALGARMTGGGFGGSAIALAPTERLLGLREKVVAGFADHDWDPPTLFTVRPSPGAHRLE